MFLKTLFVTLHRGTIPRVCERTAKVREISEDEGVKWQVFLSPERKMR